LTRGKQEGNAQAPKPKPKTNPVTNTEVDLHNLVSDSIRRTTTPPTRTTMSRTPVISNGASSKKDKAEATLLKKGCLEATVLSVYDLPFSDRPTAVTVSVCGMTLQSGPPSARHKDRNSFRFAQGTSPKTGTATSPSDVVKLVAPLRSLYRSDLTVRVIYANNPQKYLETTYSLRQLRVAETKWLILNLTPSSEASNATLATTKTKNGKSATASSSTMSSNASTSSSLPDDLDLGPQPTIRIKLKMTGPYRAEVAAAVGLAQAWFGLVDNVEHKTSSVLSKAPTVPHKELLILPAIPFVALCVVIAPVFAGVTMVGLPFFLPVILVAIVAIVGALLACTGLYASTKSGRAQVSGTIAPLLEHLVGSRAGQSLLYDTGPRPTPVSVGRHVVPSGMWSRLLLSLLIDLIGSASYLLPVVGEGLDLAWAPIQTTLIMSMYDSTSPNLKYVSFIEEILPFTDIVPSATIGWACEFVPPMLSKQARENPDMAKAALNMVATTTGSSTIQS